jgi:hypothetical protein
MNLHHLGGDSQHTVTPESIQCPKFSRIAYYRLAYNCIQGARYQVTALREGDQRLSDEYWLQIVTQLLTSALENLNQVEGGES